MNAAKKPAIRILMLEDVEDDQKLILKNLKKGKIDFSHQVVDNRQDFERSIEIFGPDLVIADYNLPFLPGMEALALCKEKLPDVPFIFLSGSIGEERAVESIQQGADDFVLKTNLPRLAMAVARAKKEVDVRVQKLQVQNALQLSESRFQQLLDNAPVGIYEMTLQGDILSINKKGAEIFNCDTDARKQHNVINQLHKKHRESLVKWIKNRSNGKAFYGSFESLDSSKTLELTVIPYNDQGDKKLIGICDDITERARVENIIKEKNILLESILNAIPDAVFLKDKNRKYVRINKAFEKSINMSKSEIIGKSDREIMPKPLADISDKSDRKVIKTKTLTIESQSLINHKDELAIFDTRKSPIFDRNKELIGIVGVSRNITTEKLAEERLRRSEAMLLEAERVANIGSWEFILTGESISCSYEAARILGTHFSRRSIDYQTLLKLCHLDDRAIVSEAFTNAIMDGEPFITDHRVIQADDSVKWVQVKGRPFQNAKGHIEKIVGTIQDITRQMMNQQKLEKSRELLKEAQSIARIGSFDWNIEQNILHCSDEFYNIFQIDQKGFWPTFENYLERIHPFDRELTRKQIFESLSTAQTYDIEHRVRLPDKTIKNIRTIGRFKTDDQNQPERLLGTVQDVTERKKVEEALLDGQELERRRIAMEIHDGIGQMLAATKFNVAALEGMPVEEVESQLEEIHRMLEATIDEARRITKNLSAKVLQELGLTRAINELCGQARELKNIDIQYISKIEKVRMNQNIKTTIYRIAQEAINNMIKYAECTRGTVRLYKEENYLVMTIQDDGKGFDPDHQSFQQGHGLTNMSQRAKALHGYINIESEKGKGTIINARIPLETK